MGFSAIGWEILHRSRFGDRNKKSSFSGSHRSPAGRILSAGMGKKQPNSDEAPTAFPLAEGMMTELQNKEPGA
jgi:hypothetical protein